MLDGFLCLDILLVLATGNNTDKQSEYMVRLIVDKAVLYIYGKPSLSMWCAHNKPTKIECMMLYSKAGLGALRITRF